jgi:hypothetical protein
MSAHLDEAELAAKCGGPRSYSPDEIAVLPPAPGMARRIPTEQLLLEELQELSAMTATLLRSAQESGELPLCDARLLRGKAQWLESLTERAAIDRLRTVREVLPGSAEDKARQRMVTR